MLKLTDKEIGDQLDLEDDAVYQRSDGSSVSTVNVTPLANKATSKAARGMRQLYLDYVKLSTRELCVTYGIELPLGDDHHDYGIISIIDRVSKILKALPAAGYVLKDPDQSLPECDYFEGDRFANGMVWRQSLREGEGGIAMHSLQDEIWRQSAGIEPYNFICRSCVNHKGGCGCEKGVFIAFEGANTTGCI